MMIVTTMTLPMSITKRKREYDDDGDREIHPAAKKLISKEKTIQATSTDRVYTCTTCNKEFSSFQALGGHRAGHNLRTKIDVDMAPGSVSNKSHTCSFCFEKFVSGQALGGHMKEHSEAREEKAKAESAKRKILDSENNQEDKSLQLLDSLLICREKLVKEGKGQEKAKPESPNRRILDSGNYTEDKSLQIVDSVLVKKGDPICHEMLVGEGSRFNCSPTLVTRDFFPTEAVRVEEVRVEIVPVSEENNSWLNLKLGF